MNAPSLEEIRAASAYRDATDHKMEQVREILIGDSMRRIETRMAELEARVSEFELGISRQLDALEARIDGMAGETQGEQRAAFEDLARSISDLGDQVRSIARR